MSKEGYNAQRAIEQIINWFENEDLFKQFMMQTLILAEGIVSLSKQVDESENEDGNIERIGAQILGFVCFLKLNGTHVKKLIDNPSVTEEEVDHFRKIIAKRMPDRK